MDIGTKRMYYPGGDPENGPARMYVWNGEEWVIDRIPFNETIHSHLIDLGYTWNPREAEFDDGDPENGPGTNHSPAFDEYTGTDEYIFVAVDGHVVNRENRDLEFERWITEQEER